MYIPLLLPCFGKVGTQYSTWPSRRINLRCSGSRWGPGHLSCDHSNFSSTLWPQLPLLTTVPSVVPSILDFQTIFGSWRSLWSWFLSLQALGVGSIPHLSNLLSSLCLPSSHGVLRCLLVLLKKKCIDFPPPPVLLAVGGCFWKRKVAEMCLVWHLKKKSLL